MIHDAGKVATDYDRRASEYIGALGRVEQMSEFDRELISRWRDQRSGHLLDAGCGPGHWANLLGAVGHAVTGVDLSGAFVRHAQKTYPNTTFLRADFRRLPFPAAHFDGIISWYSLIHTEPRNVPDILLEFHRILRPGGSLLLGFFEGDDGAAFDHAVTRAYFWGVDGMRGMLRQADFLTGESQQRTDPDSRPHAALVARKPGARAV